MEMSKKSKKRGNVKKVKKKKSRGRIRIVKRRGGGLKVSAEKKGLPTPQQRARLLSELDGRILLAKKFREIKDSLIKDLDGYENVTTAQIAIAESVAAMMLANEELTVQSIAYPDDYDRFEHLVVAKTLNVLVRTLEKKNLGKVSLDEDEKPREKTPSSVADYVKKAHGVSSDLSEEDEED